MALLSDIVSPRRSPPSGFERFFQDIKRRRLLAADVAELTGVAADVGMDVLGLPLSDEEVRRTGPDLIAVPEVKSRDRGHPRPLRGLWCVRRGG
jgi:hypothetical protein